MLAGPDEEVERVSVLQGLEAGREQNRVPLLQVILVNKSNDVAFFVIGVPAYRVILLV
ncbi:hypothetical protein [Pseudomonas putida]|uniref:hypothetical protein n=1 Tax=Pseudomonas putida TaxID=303 RepID=UPI0018659382|nr:hypothetical protein [Pseudomonas putida]